MTNRLDTSRVIRAPHGDMISAKSWQTEAAKRMLMNNLDPEVAEHPHALVVYGGIGRAARDWPSFVNIIKILWQKTNKGKKTNLCMKELRKLTKDGKKNFISTHHL